MKKHLCLIGVSVFGVMITARAKCDLPTILNVPDKYNAGDHSVASAPSSIGWGPVSHVFAISEYRKQCAFSVVPVVPNIAWSVRRMDYHGIFPALVVIKNKPAMCGVSEAISEIKIRSPV